eukprot:gene26990-35695_t
MAHSLVPAMPVQEDEQTTRPSSVLDDLEEDEIEKIIEDVYGRIQIFDNKILRDMPEGQSKSNIAFDWFSNYNIFFEMENANISLGTVGVRFQNGTLLSPDFALWTEERLDGFDVSSHMMQPARAPKLVCEIEWLEEVHQPRKGVDKIVNHYLSGPYSGSPDDHGVPTAVEKAWLLVSRRAGSLPVPDYMRKRSPTPTTIPSHLPTDKNRRAPTGTILPLRAQSSLSSSPIQHFVLRSTCFNQPTHEW